MGDLKLVSMLDRQGITGDERYEKFINLVSEILSRIFKCMRYEWVVNSKKEELSIPSKRDIERNIREGIEHTTNVIEGVYGTYTTESGRISIVFHYTDEIVEERKVSIYLHIADLPVTYFEETIDTTNALLEEDLERSDTMKGGK